MNQSDDIKELISALSKAQGKMRPAKFNRVNSHFKNKYADFNSCMETCRGPLAENGLAVYQTCEINDTRIMLVTVLGHVSGQWIKSYVPLIPKNLDSQSIGSAMTYAKRYGLSAILGIIADEEIDDDGEAAMGRGVNFEKTSFISSKQVAELIKLDTRLDKFCHDKLYKWVRDEFGALSLDEIPQNKFNEVLTRFTNAVKYLEQLAAEAGGQA